MEKENNRNLEENKNKTSVKASLEKQPILTSTVDEAGNYVFDHEKVNALLKWAISKTSKKI